MKRHAYDTSEESSARSMSILYTIEVLLALVGRGKLNGKTSSERVTAYAISPGMYNLGEGNSFKRTATLLCSHRLLG